jgi:alkaline phosphatase D
MKHYFFFFYFCLFGIFGNIQAQTNNVANSSNTLLQSGPMVGYSAMREVMLWVQTKTEATVYFEFWEKGKPETKAKTEKYLTKKSEGFTAHLTADLLTVGTKYEYSLFINGKKVERPYPLEFQTQVLWQWRTEPPPIKFVFGSCLYVNDPPLDRKGEPYGSNFHIFETIAKQKPEFMIWGGDNTYLREPDYDSKAGMLYRYTHSRSLPELQPLLGSIHHYATWDDHDFGPNDSDRSFVYKDISTEIFKNFWANPTYGVPTDGKGICTRVQWGDIEFFLLDDRYFKTPQDRDDIEKKLLGDQQIEWIADAISSSKASFKFLVCGVQVINAAAVYENYATCPEERQRLITRIRESNARGVFFLTGDRHHTSLSALQENDKVYPLYDLTSSSLTSGVYAPQPEEKNTNLIPNTVVVEQNFALMEITGTAKERVLKISIISHNGEVKWTKEIAAKELKNK